MRLQLTKFYEASRQRKNKSLGCCVVYIVTRVIFISDLKGR